MIDQEKAALKEHIKTLEQTVREVNHAQQSGPWWYTKGEMGLYQQVAMWLQKAEKALIEIDKLLQQSENNEVR